MSLAIDAHLCYVLHTRAYRETSLLLDVFSSEHGRVALVARGVKRGKTKLSALLQPFIPLQISWIGTGDLVTLTTVEAHGIGHALQARKVICGLYINELLIKLMHKWDPCDDLFNCYNQLLIELAADGAPEQIILRKFELQLLRSLGYALQLRHETSNGAAIQAEGYYVFDPVAGPKLVRANYLGAVKGASILALAAEDLRDKAVWADVKRLMRLVLHHHLGNKQLKSRELLQ